MSIRTPGPRLALETLEARENPSAAYLVPTAPGATFTPLLTVGESINGYKFAGIPDGMGAYDNLDGTFSVLINHELSGSVGAVRAHGSKGAFVSKYTFDKLTLQPIAGEDLIKKVMLYDATSGSYVQGTTAFIRLCAADLPSSLGAPYLGIGRASTAFFNPLSRLGTTEMIFMNGEETAGGRAFGNIVTGALAGTSYELPRLGRFAHENVVASPFPQNKTVVAGIDDTTPQALGAPSNGGGKVYFYIGSKTASGTPVERAGLTNGTNYAIQVAGVGVESRDFGLASSGPGLTKTGTFSLVNPATGGSQFLRPEDGSWDPMHPNDFYFVTTDRFDTAAAPGRSRLWRLRFDDVTRPEAGGSITMLLDGTDPGQMYDNITVDREGHVFLQEDPGNQSYLAKVWQYDNAAGDLVAVGKHNPDFFLSGGSNFLTQDEESSGIIDMSNILGRGTFLVDVQAHYPNADPTLVEGGQLLLLKTSAASVRLTDGVLNLQGTINNDRLQVSRSGRTLVARSGSEILGTFDARVVKLIRVDGSAGDDQITVARNVGVSDVITGGLGNDRITTGGHRSVAIGGQGTDRLVGTKSDLLIGGSTAHDVDESALVDIAAAWSANRSQAARVASLRGRLNATTVVADGVADRLLGAIDFDWLSI